MDRVDEALVKYNLRKEKFFKNPMDEYNYFKERVETISNYSNEFFQEQSYVQLANRYIKAIAAAGDDYESSGLVNVYRDCLEELGYDTYIVDNEVKNYKLTHGIKNGSEKTVSESGRGKR